MIGYIIRRLLSMVVVLLAVSVLTFFIMLQIPGNPFDNSDKNIPDAVIRQLEARYGLDQPPHMQYLAYMEDLVVPRVTERDLVADSRGIVEDYLVNIDVPGTESTFRWMNFGPSYRSKSRSVNDIFRDNLPVSFQLGVAAFIIALTVGIPAGVMAGLHRNTWIDYVSIGIALIGVSVPAIVSGPLLRYYFGVNLKILPPTGWGTWQHIVLPAIALGFSSSAILARLTRASLLQVLNEDYIRTARSKGLSERVVVTMHALRNALIPVVTILGPLFAALVTGTFVVELVFGIPGMGEFFISSIGNRDYPVIMGTTLLYGSFLVFANLIVDLTYAALDPRIKY